MVFAVHLVDNVIIGESFDGEVGVKFDEGVKTFSESGFGAFAQRVQVNRYFRHRDGVEREGAFCNIDGEIADAFQVVVHFQTRDHIAEISGDRLVQGENFQALFFHVKLKMVDFNIIFNDFSGFFAIGRHHRVHCVGNGIFHHAAKRQDAFFQFGNFIFGILISAKDKDADAVFDAVPFAVAIVQDRIDFLLAELFFDAVSDRIVI